MKLKYEMEIIDIDGCPIAIPLDSGDEFTGVLNMNGTTQDILELLKEEVSEDYIISALRQKYDATEEQIRNSVKKVIGILDEYNLLCKE